MKRIRDTAHSLIKKDKASEKVWNNSAVPDQYFSLICTAKKNEEPFEVFEIHFSEFYDLKVVLKDIDSTLRKMKIVTK